MQENACSSDGNVYEFDYDDEDFISSPTSPYVRTNQGTYGSKRPPALSVENIRVPVKVYYSEGDTLIPPSVSAVSTLRNTPACWETERRNTPMASIRSLDSSQVLDMINTEWDFVC